MENIFLLMALMVVGWVSVSSSIVPSPCVQSDGVCCKTMCLQDWVGFRGNCYYFSNTTKKSFVESRKDCQSRGADLVTIEDRREALFVMTQIGFLKQSVQVPEEAATGNFIGAGDWAMENKFTNLEGEELLFSYFGGNEPDGGPAHDCLVIFENADNNFVMGDVSCQVQQSYVCEVDADCKQPELQPTEAIIE